MSQHKKTETGKVQYDCSVFIELKKNFIYSFLAEASLHAVLFFNSLESKINGKGFMIKQIKNNSNCDRWIEMLIEQRKAFPF